jgi:hypothetical protein
MSATAVTGASIRNIMKNLFDRASRKRRPALSKTGIGDDCPQFALIPPISQTAAMCRFWGWRI